MHADMDGICMISSYLGRNILVINGKFVPKSKPFVIGIYCVPISNSKYEAKYCTVIMDLNYAIFAQMNNIIKAVLK